MTKQALEENNVQPEQFSTSLAQFTLHKKPKCFVEIEGIPTEELLEDAHKKALRAVSKQVSLPGFRKGNAPEALIIKHFAKDIKKEQENVIARLTLEEYKKNAPIRPLNEEDIRVGVQKAGENSFKVKILFETLPSVPSVDISSFTLAPVDHPPLTDEQVDETVRQGLFFLAKWEPLDRPIQEKDFVILDVDIIEKEPATPLFKNTRFEVTDRSMAQWMKQLLVGKNASDVVEGISVPDENMSAVEKDLFPPRKMRLTIKQVETAVMPELTPEVLASLGVESKEALRETTKKQLEEKLKQDVREKFRTQAEEFLLSQYPFELPASLINEELKFRCSHLDKDPQFMKQWNAFSQAEQKKFIEYLTVQSEKAVRLFQLGNKLLQEQKIAILPGDVKGMMENNQDLLPVQGQPGLTQEKRAELMSSLLLEKTMDYALSHATNPELAR